MIEKYIKLMLKESKKAFKKREIPVCAIIVDKNWEIISREINNRQKKYNILGHAEIQAILKAEKKIKDWRLNGYTMLVTLKPCKMCTTIIKESRLDKVYYLVDNFNNEKENVDNFWEINNFEKYKKEYNNLLKKFFNNMR